MPSEAVQSRRPSKPTIGSELAVLGSALGAGSADAGRAARPVGGGGGGVAGAGASIRRTPTYTTGVGGGGGGAAAAGAVPVALRVSETATSDDSVTTVAPIFIPFFSSNAE